MGEFRVGFLNFSRQSSGYRVGVAITATISTVLPVFLTGALAVQVRSSLHFSVVDLGVLVASFFGAASVVSIASGSLAERTSVAMLMRIAVAAAGFSVAGIALFGRSFITLLLFLVIAGTANGLNQPSANLFVIGSVDPKRRGFALGVKQAAIPVATLLSGLAVPLIALTIGWRYAYGIVALFDLLVIVAIPRGSVVAPRYSRGAVRARIALVPIVTLTVAMGLGAGTANALGAFLVSAAVHAHISPGSAGLLAAFGSASGLISRILGGYLADRRGGHHLTVIAAMVAIGSVGYAAFATEQAVLILPATLLCYAAGWGWNGVFNFAIVVNHPGAEGRATGTTQSGAFVGSVLGPLGFGFLVDHYSFTAAWGMTSVAALCSAALMLVGRRLLIRERRRGDTVSAVTS